MLRPEPYFGNQVDSIGVNAEENMAYETNQGNYGQMHSAASFSPNIQMKPLRNRRPPAHVFIGQPLRPTRPSFFGKRRKRNTFELLAFQARPTPLYDLTFQVYAF